MSPRLTNVSSKQAQKALERLGFEIPKKASGSHVLMVRPRTDEHGDVVGHDTLTLVLGKREINPFTLKGVLDQGGVSVKEFMDAL